MKISNCCTICIIKMSTSLIDARWNGWGQVVKIHFIGWGSGQKTIRNGNDLAGLYPSWKRLTSNRHLRNMEIQHDQCPRFNHNVNDNSKFLKKTSGMLLTKNPSDMFFIIIIPPSEENNLYKTNIEWLLLLLITLECHSVIQCWKLELKCKLSMCWIKIKCDMTLHQCDCTTNVSGLKHFSIMIRNA